MALAAKAFWGNRKSIKKPKNSRTPSKGSEPRIDRARTWYNCGNVNHFVAKCPFENREDNGGKLVRKDKTKSFPNKNFVRRKVPNALYAQEGKVEEEYMSGGEDEVVGVAHVAIATSSSSPLSLFESPNKNVPTPYTCLMAKGTSVTPS